MKNRLHFAIVGGLLVVGIIIGSFFDLQINQALFSNRNPFGIGVSMFGMAPGYAFLSLFGGAFLYLVLQQNYKKPVKIVLVLLAFLALGSAAYFTGGEFFSRNGLDIDGVGYEILGISIAAVVHVGIFILGFKLGKRIKGKYAWVALLILMIMVLISLVPCVTVLKNIMHRPRYRTIQLDIEGITFHNWWEPFTDYKSYINDIVPKEEFKSFPSGHSACAMVVMMLLMYLPLFNEKLLKHQTLLFYLGTLYAMFVAFTRMLVGAHFLSDVCFGMLFTLVCAFVGNEIIIRKKLLE